jgi:CHAT domain-containing protein
VDEFRAEMADTIQKRFGLGVDLEPAVGAKAERRINETSAKLREKVWQPIEQRLTGRKRVYIAPDGQLGLIPFEALAISDEKGWQYLAEEDVELVYLNTGRDLTRAVASRAVARTGSNTALFFADPDFDAEPAEVAASLAGLTAGADVLHVPQPATLGTSSGERPHRRKVKRNWRRVSGTREIGERAQRRLQELGWQVTSYTGRDAAKERVTGVTSSPRILQFSTHGYALDAPADSAAEWESPLLRSMLIFAGANRWTPENAVFYRIGDAVVRESDAHERSLTGESIEVSDGVLTAYEVTGRDLRGTDLVNLTACETGLGQVTADGVVGLRQAFLLAGCRALTMSMWSIPTDETVDQIVDFYSRWLADSRGAAASPYEAFRAAQRGALARARNSPKSGYSGHPFFWAGVIYAGDPGDLPETPGREEPTN